MIVDLFLVTHPTHNDITPSELRQQMGDDTPKPCGVFGPNGELYYVFTVDIRCNPQELCQRLGFGYIHLDYMEITSRVYTSNSRINLRSPLWIALFLALWKKEEGITCSAYSLWRRCHWWGRNNNQMTQ